MTTISYNDAAFRALFPAYSNTTTYPTTFVMLRWDTATLYISDQNGGCYTGGLNLAQQTQALNLMTAHLVYLSNLIAQGQNPGIEVSASIDKIAVSIEPPPVNNQWQYWLQTTPWGAQLLALLQVVGVGGFYYGGSLELGAFRRAGGFRGW